MPTKKSDSSSSAPSAKASSSRAAKVERKPARRSISADATTKSHSRPRQSEVVAAPLADAHSQASVPQALAKPDHTWLFGLFKPSDLEQKALLHLFTSNGAVTLSQLASQLGMPVEQLGSILAPQGLLRGTALVEVESSAELGYPHPEERVVLGRGLLVAQHDRETLPTYLPGLSVLPTPEPDAAWAAAFVADRPAQLVLDLVKERLVSTRPLLLLLSGCSGETTSLLTQAVRLRLSRPVFYLDGAALAGWPQPELVCALRRLRRDTDLRGAALVVQDVEHLGGAWRALTQPKPSGQTAPVILCSSGAIAQPRHFAGATYGNPLQLMTHSLRTASTNPANSASSTATEESDHPDIDRSREEARRQAAVDAARAMGKPIPKELQSVDSAASVVKTTATAAASAPAIPLAHTKPAPASAPPKVEAAPRTETPTAQASPRPVNPRLAAALAKAGLPPAGSGMSRGERNAAEPAPSTSNSAPATAPASPATDLPPTMQPNPEPSPLPAVVSDATPTAIPPGEELADGPPLPLSDDAKLDEMIGVAKNTTSNNQRSQLLRRLAGTKSPHVIQLFRMFTNHPHPGVRSAAEAGMESIFGSHWNRARTIAPPIQPPRSDDGGRGPGGAF